MNELALFAGAGGGILGGHLLGWKTICAVEIEDYPRRVLLARQRDGMLPRFPIWDDVCTFDGKPWRGRVDVISGGFPCQDISAAGKGAGIEGARSGLWVEFARIIREVRPRFVFVENSPMLVSRGLGRVLGDLASMGFDARWGVLGADDAGAPHRRKRIWVLADDTDKRRGEGRPRGSNPGSARKQQQTFRHADSNSESVSAIDDEVAKLSSHAANPNGINRGAGAGRENRAQTDNRCWWSTEPNVDRVADGMASRVDRLRSIGNGQVPAVARLAWEVLKQ